MLFIIATYINLLKILFLTQTLTPTLILNPNHYTAIVTRILLSSA